MEDDRADKSRADIEGQVSECSPLSKANVVVSVESPYSSPRESESIREEGTTCSVGNTLAVKLPSKRVSWSPEPEVHYYNREVNSFKVFHKLDGKVQSRNLSDDMVQQKSKYKSEKVESFEEIEESVSNTSERIQCRKVKSRQHNLVRQQAVDISSYPETRDGVNSEKTSPKCKTVIHQRSLDISEHLISKNESSNISEQDKRNKKMKRLSQWIPQEATGTSKGCNNPEDNMLDVSEEVRRKAHSSKCIPVPQISMNNSKIQASLERKKKVHPKKFNLSQQTSADVAFLEKNSCIKPHSRIVRQSSVDISKLSLSVKQKNEKYFKQPKLTRQTSVNIPGIPVSLQEEDKSHLNKCGLMQQPSDTSINPISHTEKKVTPLSLAGQAYAIAKVPETSRKPKYKKHTRLLQQKSIDVCEGISALSNTKDHSRKNSMARQKSLEVFEGSTKVKSKTQSKKFHFVQQEHISEESEDNSEYVTKFFEEMKRTMHSSKCRLIKPQLLEISQDYVNISDKIYGIHTQAPELFKLENITHSNECCLVQQNSINTSDKSDNVKMEAIPESPEIVLDTFSAICKKLNKPGRMAKSIDDASEATHITFDDEHSDIIENEDSIFFEDEYSISSNEDRNSPDEDRYTSSKHGYLVHQEAVDIPDDVNSMAAFVPSDSAFITIPRKGREKMLRNKSEILPSCAEKGKLIVRQASAELPQSNNMDKQVISTNTSALALPTVNKTVKLASNTMPDNSKTIIQYSHTRSTDLSKNEPTTVDQPKKFGKAYSMDIRAVSGVSERDIDSILERTKMNKYRDTANGLKSVEFVQLRKVSSANSSFSRSPSRPLGTLPSPRGSSASLQKLLLPLQWSELHKPGRKARYSPPSSLEILRNAIQDGSSPTPDRLLPFSKCSSSIM